MKGNVDITELDTAKLCPISLTDSGVIKPIEGYNALYNVSKGKYCTTVAKGYTVVQHKDYFEASLKALDNLKIQYTAEIRQQGNIGYMDVTFLNKNLKFTKLGEEFATGFRLVNSYNKSTGLIVAPKFTRLACLNGMVMSKYKQVMNARHNSASAKNYEAYLEKQLARVIGMDTTLQQFVSECMAESIEWGICTKLIEKLFSQRKHRKEVLQRLGIAVVKKQSTTSIASVQDLMKGKSVENDEDTYEWIDGEKLINRWSVYNAITHYITHSEQLGPNVEAYFQRIGERVLYNKVEKLVTVEI